MSEWVWYSVESLISFRLENGGNKLEQIGPIVVNMLNMELLRTWTCYKIMIKALHKSLFHIMNYGYEGRDYQPYLTTTLPGSGRNSKTGNCGASLWSQITFTLSIGTYAHSRK